MRATALFGVLFLAHVLSLSGRHLPVSFWTPFAYFWQDIATALVFAAFEVVLRRRNRLGWLLYSGITFYAAVNVPIARVLSSPLTFRMIEATGRTISDSIKYYLTFGNIAMFAAVVAAGIVLPLILSKLNWQPRTVFLIPAAICMTVAGPFAALKVETSGLDRNAIGALWPSKVSTLSHALTSSSRKSPYSSAAVEDLRSLSGFAKGRNVVMIVLESTATRYLRPYGAVEDPMPNLTQLSRQAIVFENAYAAYPESIKGLDSILCARYPEFKTKAESRGDGCESIAAQLSNNGYNTGLFHSGRFDYLGMRAVVENRGFDMLNDAGDISGNINSSFGVDEPSTVRTMLQWIDSLPRGHPFFAAYLPVAGHHPYASPGPDIFPDKSELDRYRNALHYGDAAIDELMEGLRERNLFDRTLFLIFGDHGEAFGQHEANYGHTLFIYDENVRVPYLVVAPGAIHRQIRVQRVASLIDTSPTILDLLGLQFSQESAGKTLLDPAPEMSLFFTDYSLRWAGLRDSCWKFIHEMGAPHSQLYDVCSDPDELHDLSPTNADRVKKYRFVFQEH